MFIKARPHVIPKSFVCFFNQRQLITTYAAGDWEDRKDAALMTRRAVIIAFAQLPTSFDHDRAVLFVGAKIIFEINIRSRARARYRSDDRNISGTGANARIGNAELDPLLGDILGRIAGNDY